MQEKVIEGHIGKYLAEKATEVITIYDVYRKTMPYGFLCSKGNIVTCFNRDYEPIEFCGQAVNKFRTWLDTENKRVNVLSDFAELAGYRSHVIAGTTYEGYQWFFYDDHTAPYYEKGAKKTRREYAEKLKAFIDSLDKTYNPQLLEAE